MVTIALLVSLLAAGVLGSVHCVAMCGAFAAAAGRRGAVASSWYSAGRLTAYAALGGVAGAVGGGMHASLAGLWQASAALALAAGLALGLLGLRALLPRRAGRAGGGPLVWAYARLVPLVRACAGARRSDQAYVLGVLNGLLPCPVVAPMLLAALASGSAASGSTLLLALGLGTLPAMLLAGHGGARLVDGGGRLTRTTRWGGLAPGVAMLVLGMATAARPFLLPGPAHGHGW